MMKSPTSRTLETAGIILILLIYSGLAFRRSHHPAHDLALPGLRLIASDGIRSYYVQSGNRSPDQGPLPVIICIGNRYLQPDILGRFTGQLGEPVILIWCGLLNDLSDATQVDDPVLWEKKRSEFKSLLKRYREIPGFDEHRVYLTGFSFTGVYAWMLAYDEPERYAGVVAMSAVCYPKQIQQRIEAAKTVVTVVVRGERDKWLTMHRAEEERTGRIIESQNPRSKFTTKPGEGHSEMTNYWSENLRYILQFRQNESPTAKNPRRPHQTATPLPASSPDTTREAIGRSGSHHL